MTTTESDYKDFIRRFRNDIYDAKNLDRLDEYIAEDCLSHTPALPEPGRGIDEYRKFTEMLHAAFPDAEDTIEDIVAEGDKVAVRIRMRGTHEGPFLDLEPTENEVDVTGMVIYRIEDGKIAEDWHQADMMGLMQQLGIQ